MGKTALISGITGQTGAYLAKYLIDRKYTVIGASRDHESADLSRLKTLEILDSITLTSLAPADFRSVLQAINRFQPSEIYYMGGQTSVGLSFGQPFEAFESISVGTLNFLEAIRMMDLECRFFNAGSTECFGNHGRDVVTEMSAMKPKSPYAIAKCTSFWITSSYRDNYGIFACTGLLSNHESPLRPSRFVTSKIVQGVRDIKAGVKNHIELGNLNVMRDWGWAPDYVDAIYRIVRADQPKDYIVATGQSHTLRELVAGLCNIAGVDPGLVVRANPELLRPSDVELSYVSPQKIKELLGWVPTTSFQDLMHNLYYGNLF